MFYLQYFLLIMFGCLINESRAEYCVQTLKHLAEVQGIFVACIIKSTNPAISCASCYIEFNNISLEYKKLVSNQTCADRYLNQNPLNIVYNMQKTLVDIWNKEFCDDCFENGGPSNSSLEFDQLKTKFDNCLGTYKTDICQKCQGFYLDLNGFYKQMEKDKKRKICFDMQDAMNRTRSTWSKTLKCCHREINATLFIVGSCLFGALSVIFYLGMYWYTKRLERNHEVIDSTFNSDNQASTSAGISSGTLENLQSTTSTSSTNALEEIADIKKERYVSKGHTNLNKL